MCTELLFGLPCTNFKCPNNLFWKDLKLNREKIRMTDRALEIRNCCCLILNPWTSEEISNAWGTTREEIKRSEEEAFKKLEREVRISRKRSPSTATLN
jgi:DNA-directed RNA polymerase sigma subunit (sigma70/sigma32)